MLFGELGPQRVEVDVSGRLSILGGFVIFDEGVGNIGAAPQEAFAFWRQVCTLFLERRDHGRRHGSGHGSEFWRRWAVELDIVTMTWNDFEVLFQWGATIETL